MKRKDNWVSGRVTITTEAGRVGRWGWTSPDAPGLAVTLATKRLPKRDLWVVTHVSSGRAVQSKVFNETHELPDTYSVATARKLAIELAKLTDWTQPALKLEKAATKEFSEQLQVTFVRVLRTAKVRAR